MSGHKPGIIVLSNDDDNTFEWMSDGWYPMNERHTAEAQALFAKAGSCIQAGKDVQDCVTRLEKAGFNIMKEWDNE